MADASSLFTFGRVRVLENFLITSEKQRRLLAANTADDMLSTLLEMGFGSGIRVETPYEYETLIDNELKETYKMVRESTPNTAITDLFFLKYDYQNLKVLLKNQLLKEESDELLIPYGIVPIDGMKSAIVGKPVNTLPLEMENLIKDFIEGKFSASDIGFVVDKAMYAQIKRSLLKIKSKPIKTYWNTQADYNNVLSLFRAKELKDISLLEKAYLDLGNIKLSDMEEAFGKSDEEAVEMIKRSNLDVGISQGLDYYLSNRNLSVLEKNRDNYFIRLFKPLSADPFEIATLIGYLLAKEQQAKFVRLVMVAKINDLPSNLVEERMRELYA